MGPAVSRHSALSTRLPSLCGSQAVRLMAGSMVEGAGVPVAVPPCFAFRLGGIQHLRFCDT